VPTLLLIRHAQGSFGSEDYDVLSERGREQTVALAAELDRRGVRLDRLVSGSLARQRDTAAAIAAAQELAPAIDPRWDEYDSEGFVARHAASASPPSTTREFQAILDAALVAWVAGGAGDGSWPAFRDRVAAALGELTESLGPGQTALVCTSGGPLAAVCVALLGLPDKALVPFNRVLVNASVTKVISGRSGSTLVSFNEHGYLEATDGALVTYR
jgi:broad specificity phosphatase PhoE